MAVRLAENLFGPLDFGLLPNTRIIIVSDAPRDAVVSALVQRPDWIRIVETGEEITVPIDDDAAFEAELERLHAKHGRGVWGPNWVSPVFLGPLGPEIAADCKDGMTPEMAAAVIRALREELARFGVEDAEVQSDGPEPDYAQVLAESLNADL